MTSMTYAPIGAFATPNCLSVGDIFTPLAKFSRWHLDRQARKTLYAMTDEQLFDFGIIRAEINNLSFRATPVK